MVRLLTPEEAMRKVLTNHIKKVSNRENLPTWVSRLSIPGLSILIELIEHGVVSVGTFFPLLVTDSTQKLIDFRPHLNYLFGELDDETTQP